MGSSRYPGSGSMHDLKLQGRPRSYLAYYTLVHSAHSIPAPPDGEILLHALCIPAATASRPSTVTEKPIPPRTTYPPAHWHTRTHARARARTEGHCVGKAAQGVFRTSLAISSDLGWRRPRREQCTRQFARPTPKNRSLHSKCSTASSQLEVLAAVVGGATSAASAHCQHQQRPVALKPASSSV